MAQRVGARGREKTAWVGRSAFSGHPTSCKVTDVALRQALLRSQGCLSSLSPCLPTHRTPLGWGLFFTCPSGSAVQATWIFRDWEEGLEPAGRQDPGSPLWSRQVSP